MTKFALSRRGMMKGVAATAAASFLGHKVHAEPVVHDVRIKRFKFVPSRIDVRVGDRIRWINDDLAPHTATADEFGWDTGEIAQNGTADIEVSERMETTYFCVFHPHMKAEIRIL